jgi:SNF2 family DNA or RNA helicase
LTEDLVKELHNRLRPYFLRRLKGQVLQLPPKVCYWYNAKVHLTHGS